MTTTARQVENACQHIQQHLEGFRANAEQVWRFQRCLAGIAWLREQYRADQALLGPHMDRIKELSRQVHEALAGAAQALTAKYLQASSALAAWEAVREACRDALLALAAGQNVQRFDGAGGWVEVKRASSICLPKPGTQQREQLNSLISQAGRWAEVAYPNPAKLLKAVEAGLFSTEQAGEISRLCPAQTICRLVPHADGKPQ